MMMMKVGRQATALMSLMGANTDKRCTFEAKRRRVALDRVALGAVLGAHCRAWPTEGERQSEEGEEEEEEEERK